MQGHGYTVPLPNPMRFDTHRISAQLVNELQSGRPRLEVTYDGGDLIRVEVDQRDVVQIYLIESPITVYEIKGIIQANTEAGIYSLFILWCDLLLPRDRARYRATDWMTALIDLHAGKIYAFDAHADLCIFPVYFETSGSVYRIHYGGAIDATQLAGITSRLAAPFTGVWRMADFEGQPHNTLAAHVNPTLSPYFAQLGIAATDDRDAIKQAYRRLARLYHPDVDTSPGATERMQRLNDAYEHLLADLDQADQPDA